MDKPAHKSDAQLDDDNLYVAAVEVNELLKEFLSVNKPEDPNTAKLYEDHINVICSDPTKLRDFMMRVSLVDDPDDFAKTIFNMFEEGIKLGNAEKAHSHQPNKCTSTFLQNLKIDENLLRNPEDDTYVISYIDCPYEDITSECVSYDLTPVLNTTQANTDAQMEETFETYLPLDQQEINETSYVGEQVEVYIMEEELPEKMETSEHLLENEASDAASQLQPESEFDAIPSCRRVATKRRSSWEQSEDALLNIKKFRRSMD